VSTDLLRVYVDGFNLYYGLHDQARCRLLWLDLVKLAQNLPPRSQVDNVHYFTAPVLGDAAAARRQSEYQSALRAANGSTITITQGRYQTKTKECRSCGATWQDREEKETDVNIAVSLVADAAEKRMTTAMLISADSDLIPAIRVARRLNPSLVVFAAFPPKRFSADLMREMPYSFHINVARIRASLLPEQVPGNGGIVFRRPSKWRN